MHNYHHATSTVELCYIPVYSYSRCFEKSNHFLHVVGWHTKKNLWEWDALTFATARSAISRSSATAATMRSATILTGVLGASSRLPQRIRASSTKGSGRVCRLVRVCVPLVPHWCEQELRLVQLLTRQLTALQGGGAALRRVVFFPRRNLPPSSKAGQSSFYSWFSYRLHAMTTLPQIVNFPEVFIYSHRELKQNGRILLCVFTLRIYCPIATISIGPLDLLNLYTIISTCITVPSSKVLDESVNHITKCSNNSELIDLIVS